MSSFIYQSPPVMPELCSLRRGTNPATGAPGAVAVDNVNCRFVPTSRLPINPAGGAKVIPEAWVDLPFGTDVRDGNVLTWDNLGHRWVMTFDWLTADVVEVPRASGLYFFVLKREDRYRGFPGFHRRAYLCSGIVL